MAMTKFCFYSVMSSQRKVFQVQDIWKFYALYNLHFYKETVDFCIFLFVPFYTILKRQFQILFFPLLFVDWGRPVLTTLRNPKTWDNKNSNMVIWTKIHIFHLGQGWHPISSTGHTLITKCIHNKSIIINNNKDFQTFW